MAEKTNVIVGLEAEDWLKMWDGGWSHDHHHVHDETHFTSCGDEDSHHELHSECHRHEHEFDSEKAKVDVFLKRHLSHLTSGKTIFVSLCGSSPDMEWLCDKGYSVVGAEISETAVKKVFEKEHGDPIPFSVIVDGDLKMYSAMDGKKLKVYVGNFFDDALNSEKLGKFDCIWDAHGIVSIPVSQQEPYTKKLLTFIKPGGKILFSTVEYDVAKLKSGPAPAPVPASRLQELFPQCEMKLLENGPLAGGELEGVDEWSNPVVLITSSY